MELNIIVPWKPTAHDFRPTTKTITGLIFKLKRGLLFCVCWDKLSKLILHHEWSYLADWILLIEKNGKARNLEWDGLETK